MYIYIYRERERDEQVKRVLRSDTRPVSRPYDFQV